MAFIVADTPPETEPAGKQPRPASVDQIAEWAEVLFGGQPPIDGGLVYLTSVRVYSVATKAFDTRNCPFVADAQGFRALAKTARDLTPRAEAVWYNLNPVSAKADGSPKNIDILRRRILLIDFDYVDHSQSSTDEEKQETKLAALNARRLLSERFGWPKPILADSGNGTHLLYRIELPNDDEAATLVRRTLQAIAYHFDTDTAKVGTECHDARRVTKVYGTLARKPFKRPDGTLDWEPTAERPHRASAILEKPEKWEVVSVDQLKAVAITGPLDAKPSNGNGHTNGNGNGNGHHPILPPTEGFIAKGFDHSSRDWRLERARLYVAKMPPAVSGSGGHNQTFAVACALVKGFDLTLAEARPILEEYNATCDPPWSDRELTHKLESADSATDEKPRGYIFDEDRATFEGTNTPAPEAAPKRRGRPPVSKNKEKLAKADMPVVKGAGGLKEPADDPHLLARKYLQQHATHLQTERTLRYWNEGWYRWSTSNHWYETPTIEVKSALVTHIKTEYDAIALAKDVPVEAVGTHGVLNVLQAVTANTILPMVDYPVMPCWLDAQPADPSPKECIAATNGILHLPRVCYGREGEDGILPATPRYFNCNSLGYAWEQDAPPPTTWLKFLDSIYPNDKQAIEHLQEQFGYLIVPDTSLDSILFVIGPPRSGKGTIARTIEMLVGEANVVSFSLEMLSSEFGPAELIGKSVAIIPEMRISGKSDVHLITERMLSISGKDGQSFNRKNRSRWKGKIYARFVGFANDFPRLVDYSNALLSRLYLLKLTHSFLGKEDRTLGDKIAAEKAGILNWAIGGWKRLKERGRFIQPDSGMLELKDARDRINPVAAFLSDSCELGQDLRVPRAELFSAWKTWCEAQNREGVGNIAEFGAKLRQSVPFLQDQRLGGGDRQRLYVGLRLRPVEGSAY